MVLAVPSRTSSLRQPRLVRGCSVGQLWLVGLRRGPGMALSHHWDDLSGPLPRRDDFIARIKSSRPSMDFCSPSTYRTSLSSPVTRRGLRSGLAVRGPVLVASVRRPPDEGSRTLCAPPSSLPAASTPGKAPKCSAIGSAEPSALSWSVLVGSHHLDGLLHRWACRLVASCIRPWGSPRFRSRRDPTAPPKWTDGTERHALSRSAHTLRRIPPCRHRHAVTSAPTSLAVYREASFPCLHNHVAVTVRA